ncbi:hypothetical protein Q1695_002778 [Nippostrongylus brasiliensis]|nr:hypothetical protein Q1695_002778 [Nippostrongylus brasiliensis]
MLGDYAHQSLLTGEVASSPLTSLSRRSTFDEDSFFSPSKPKSEQRTSRPVSSPQQVHKLPTVHDKVLRWFLDLIETRRLRASACASTICAFLFIVSITTLKFSIRSPLQCLSDAICSLFSLWAWITCVVIVMLSFAMCWTLLNLVVRADQTKRLPLGSLDTWLAFSAVLLYDVVYSVIIMRSTNFGFEERFLSCMIVQSSVISAFYSIFRNDFHLHFSGSAAQIGLVHTISTMFAIGQESTLISTCRDAARVTVASGIFGSILGLFIHGWSSLLHVFNISFHTYTFVIVFGQLFAIKALLKLVCHIVMKPISFALPPPFVVHSPTPEQMRTLPVVLDSQNVLLKLFAFTDLRRIAWTDRSRRLEVFSLSQPGGHPRNWTNVSAVCMNVLSRLHSEIQIASSRLENPGIDKDRGDLSDDDFADVDREMLMMPHKSRKQIYSSAVRQRHRVAIRPMARHNEKAIQHQLAWWNSFISNFASQEVVSRYDTTIAVLAIESLYMFVVESYQEDRYGVVLRDLAGVINLLVQLIQTIDKYFRLKANGIVSTSGDNNVKLLDSTLQTALLRISGKFGDDLRALDLSREQLQTIRMVCQSDL